MPLSLERRGRLIPPPPSSSKRSLLESWPSALSAVAALVAATTAAYSANVNNHVESSNARQKIYEQQIKACADWMDDTPGLSSAIDEVGANTPTKKGEKSTRPRIEKYQHDLNVVRLVFPSDVGAAAERAAEQINSAEIIALNDALKSSLLIEEQKLESVADQVSAACTKHVQDYAGFK